MFPSVPSSRSGTFKTALARMGGIWRDLTPGATVESMLGTWFPAARVVCSATPEVPGNRHLDVQTKPADLDDVDVGIVRAAFGVAETGSIWLSEHQYVVNALGYLSQHLIVLLDPADILDNLHAAYARPEFSRANYSVLMSGPSATADIEGVLVRGAQGIRSLTIVAAPRRA